jgi:hypothetical protein
MKRSLTRLFVALVTFFATLVELAVRIVQLGVVLVERASRCVAAPVPTAASPVACPKPPVAKTDDTAERLTSALTGLGFRAGAVRAFTATVRSRLEKEPLEGLVREGIATLSN